MLLWNHGRLDQAGPGDYRTDGRKLLEHLND
jgi:hypothetical protein